VKRIVNKATATPTRRNAALLSPVTHGATVYRQPWDRLRGIRDGHDREAIVAALTQAIASDCSNTAELPIMAEALGTGDDVTDRSHYCYALNVAPSVSMSAVAFRQHLVNSLNYTGEAYIIEARKTLTPLVGGRVEIQPAGMGSTHADGSPMLVAGYRVLDDAGHLRGTYDGAGRAVGDGAIAGSVLHRVYIPHPENPLRANPPIQAAGLPVDVLHYQRQATKSILVNDGMPAGVLSITSPVDGADLDQSEIEEAERRINEKASDTTRKGRVLVLNASTSYQPLGAPALSAGWVEIAENARREILAVWRAPESVLGIGGNRTYENQRVELAAYYQATVLPILNLICATLNQQARRLGYVLWVDTSNVAALNEGLDEVATRAASLVAAGIVSINEARELLGLPPVEAVTEEPPAEPVLDEGRGVSRDATPLAGRRSIQGDEFSDRLDRAAATFEEQLNVYATRYHARLASQIAGGLRRRAGVNRADGSETPVPQVTADEIVDVDARNSELLADLGGLFADASTVIGEVVADALDVSLSDAVKDVWREIGANRLDRLVNGSTSYPGWTRQIVDDVTEAIQAAYQAGESVDGAIARVEALVGPDRAERVARTELSGLMNEVSYRQMKDAGVERKRWYSVGDNRTRSSHQMLNGTTIRFDEKFTVGGVAADGPHDTVLPASEVVNCRCRLIPVLD
jgi:SPP1 gp7 family putative phage head morphogenesis protein